MSLRLRILLFILTGTGLLTLLLYLIARLVILEGFVDAEHEDLTRNLEAARKVSYRMAEDLQLRGADWSSWDDMATFLEDENEAFRASNFDASTFISIGWDLLLVAREDGKLLASLSVDRANTALIEPAPGLSDWLPLLTRGMKTHAPPIVGFARLGDAFYVLASSPILRTSKAPGKFAGRFIIGRRIDDAWLDRLKNFATEGVSLLGVDDPLPPEVRPARQALLGGAPTWVNPLDEEMLTGFALIDDISGKPIILLRLDQPRELYIRGQHAIRSSLAGVLLGGIAMSLAALTFFGSLILSPLRKLLAAIEQLETGQDVQLALERQDELGTLTQGFNHMARTIHDRQQELTKARELAEQASRAKSDFLASMSHEIRTPLNGVLGFADLLATTKLSPEQQEYVTTIRHSSHLLLTVINDILDYSRIEAGKLEVKLEPVPLLSAVRDVVELLSTRAEAKGLLLGVMVDPAAPGYVCGDPVRFRQILLNLIGNAVKFTEQGSILIQVERLEQSGTDMAQFTIRDTGPGIDPADLPKLFRRFSQVDSSPTRTHGGTGLGLAIARQLIEQHGGSITVESARGEGSTFRFTLPAHGASGQKAPMFPAPQLVPPGLSVLVVHSHPLAQTCLERLLKRWGVPALFWSSLPGEVPQETLPLPALWLLSDEVPALALESLLARLKGPRPAMVRLASRHGDALPLSPSILPDAVVAGPIGLPHGLASALDLAWLARNSSTPAPALQETRPLEEGVLRTGLRLNPTPLPSPSLGVHALDDSSKQLQSLAASRGVTSGEFNALQLLAARSGYATAPSAGVPEGRPGGTEAAPASGRPDPSVRGGMPPPPTGGITIMPSPAPGSVTGPRPFTGRRLLLAEDNRVNQRLATTLLQRLGFEVVCADNGRLALDALRAEPFDLVLMDCHMPELDGFAATQAIRRDPTLPPNLPVVALSASAMQEEQQRCMTVGMNDFLAKPFTAAAIEAMVKKWLPEKPARSTA